MQAEVNGINGNVALPVDVRRDAGVGLAVIPLDELMAQLQGGYLGTCMV